MLADQPFLGLIELRLRLQNQEKIVARLRNHAIGHRAWNIDVVTLLKWQRTEVGLNRSLPPMDKVQLVAIGVPEIKRHRLGTPGNENLNVIVTDECDRPALRIIEIAGPELVQVEC